MEQLLSSPQLLIVLTGKAASGKDTMMQRLIQQFPFISPLVTTTTRAPRPGETDGVDYHFVSLEQFEQMKDKGAVIEEVVIAGIHYGTTNQELKKVLTHQNLIWRIDPTRSAHLEELFVSFFDPLTAKDLLNRTVVIYLDADVETLENRMISRGMSRENIQKRLTQDEVDSQSVKQRFTNIVANQDGKFDQAFAKVVGLIAQKQKQLS